LAITQLGKDLLMHILELLLLLFSITNVVVGGEFTALVKFLTATVIASTKDIGLDFIG